MACEASVAPSSGLPLTAFFSVPRPTRLSEEIFAPVATLWRYTDIDDVIGRINASKYGLQAGIFTSTQSRVAEPPCCALPARLIAKEEGGVPSPILITIFCRCHRRYDHGPRLIPHTLVLATLSPGIVRRGHQAGFRRLPRDSCRRRSDQRRAQRPRRLAALRWHQGMPKVLIYVPGSCMGSITGWPPAVPDFLHRRPPHPLTQSHHTIPHASSYHGRTRAWDERASDTQSRSFRRRKSCCSRTLCDKIGQSVSSDEHWCLQFPFTDRWRYPNPAPLRGDITSTLSHLSANPLPPLLLSQPSTMGASSRAGGCRG